MEILTTIEAVRNTINTWKNKGIQLDLFLQWDIYMMVMLH